MSTFLWCLPFFTIWQNAQRQSFKTLNQKSSQTFDRVTGTLLSQSRPSSRFAFRGNRKFSRNQPSPSLSGSWSRKWVTWATWVKGHPFSDQIIKGFYFYTIPYNSLFISQKAQWPIWGNESSVAHLVEHQTYNPRAWVLLPPKFWSEVKFFS